MGGWIERNRDRFADAEAVRDTVYGGTLGWTAKGLGNLKLNFVGSSLEKGSALGTKSMSMGSVVVDLPNIKDKGKLYGVPYGHRLIPDARAREYGKPARVLERSPGHFVEWINACKGGKPAGSNFVDHAAHLAAVVLMGNIAIRTQEKLYWDADKLQFKNSDLANQLMNPPYRAGWTL
mgnify:CR=1 FL=1